MVNLPGMKQRPRKPGAAKGGGVSRVTPPMAVDIFHRAHAKHGESYRVIGRRFGISAVSVGAIARGQTHAGLFRRELVGEGYDYWIWALGAPWARYLMTTGRKRSRR